jgi:hypothetical protein
MVKNTKNYSSSSRCKVANKVEGEGRLAEDD